MKIPFVLHTCIRTGRWALTLLGIAVVFAPVARAGTPPAWPLAISADGRHVVDQSGQPVFLHLESAWFLLGRLDRADTIYYLDDRDARGFDGMLVQFPMPEWFGQVANAYGEPPFLVDGDFTVPNEAYFEHADWVVQQALDRGLTLFLAPAYLGWGCLGTSESGGWCPDMLAMGEEVMRDWGRWMGNRYRSWPNIVWIDGGDCDAAAHGAMGVVDAVAEGLQEVDPAHLHTAFCDRYHSAADCYDRPWLQLNSTYGDCSATPALLRADYERSPRRPFFFIEGRYEFFGDWTEVCMRSQAYWSILGGAVGQVFGVFPVHAFDPGWKDYLDSPGTRSMEYFERLIRSRRWQLLEPDTDKSVLVSGAGDIAGPSFAAAARASDGSSLIVYTPDLRALTVDLSRVGDTTATAWWFDPASGQPQLIGSFPASGEREFTPPSSGDWVLVVDAASAGFRPPGADVPVVEKDMGAVKRQYERH